MAKKKTTKNQKSFEQTLWNTADKLRGSVESSEYKHVVLSLIFLKFVSDKFEVRKAEIIADGQEKYLDMVEFYTMKNVFYLPEESRWSFIRKQAKQDDIALKIDTALHKEQCPDLKADFIMANPPFNLKAWRGKDELTDDPRWAGYEVPPTGNANYAWILHKISKLSETGVAGFVLANGSMSTNTSGEGAIRRKIIENDLVDCMIALPGQLFYTTQIPVCLWFLTKSKQARALNGHGEINHRNRPSETLFIDARNMGNMVDRTHKEVFFLSCTYI